MRLDAGDIADLRPVIACVVAETIERIQANNAKLGERLAYPESEAAQLLGVATHVLRDARLRGEIFASKCGKKTLYTKADLLGYLNKQRT